MKPVVLVVLDGWGIAPPGPGNAISRSKLPNYTHYWYSYPHTTLAASGESVGLPRGEDGNTETGHLNLGAGRIVYQDLPRINMAIADGSFYKNPAFLSALNHVKKTGGKLHLLGLVGSGGVHSNIEHVYALLNFCKEQQFMNVFLHLITDGRDSPPTLGHTYIEQVEKEVQMLSIGTIASVMGRYYAMDRDMRWDRTERAYRSLTLGEGKKSLTPQQAVDAAYKAGQTDEFIEPTLITNADSSPKALVSANDAVIFFNFRIDRTRQLTKAFVLPEFNKDTVRVAGFDPYTIKYYKKHIVENVSFQGPFTRGPKIANLFFVTMTEYEKNLPVDAIAFPPQVVAFPLGRVLTTHELHQLRVSETEKERFVTYYFNGQREEAFPFEDRLIVPSPKVATYDLKPEMSAREMTTSLIGELNRQFYQFILVNYANADMVAHTGVIDAAVVACETIDECLGKLVPAILVQEGYCIITADHGNVEEMLDAATGGIDTEHSTFPVPFIVIGKEFESKMAELVSGILADVAPTILSLLGLPKPSDMTGRNLLA